MYIFYNYQGIRHQIHHLSGSQFIFFYVPMYCMSGDNILPVERHGRFFFFVDSILFVLKNHPLLGIICSSFVEETTISCNLKYVIMIRLAIIRYCHTIISNIHYFKRTLQTVYIRGFVIWQSPNKYVGIASYRLKGHFFIFNIIIPSLSITQNLCKTSEMSNLASNPFDVAACGHCMA